MRDRAIGRKAALGALAEQRASPAFVTAMRPDSFSKRYIREKRAEGFDMGSLAKGTLLWLLGVPLSVIILIALFTNYI